MKNNNYKSQVSKILSLDPSSDMVNVEDDSAELIFGPALEGQSQDSDVTPFYISLKVHDFVLHNDMFDSRASIPAPKICFPIWANKIIILFNQTLLHIYLA